MLLALSQALLTLLGAACERSGLDKFLTAKYRTHSLFGQGSYWYGRIATMREEWLVRLMKAFQEVLDQQAEMTAMLGNI